MKRFGTIATIVLLCAAAACDNEGRKRGPSTSVTIVHAAPTHPELSFLREERTAATLEYRNAASSSFEVGQYDFNLETTLLDTGAPDRIGTFSETLVADTDYFFVITEDDSGALDPLIVTKPVFSATAADAEIVVVHAAPVFAPVDVYFGAPGADLSSINPIGGVSFKQNLAPQVFAAGDYQLSLTAAGNPLAVLFSSATLTLAAGQSNLLVITDGAGEGVGDVWVVRAAPSAVVLVDVNTPGNLRVINTATDTLARDVVVDDDFAAPLFGAVAYAAPTAYAPVAPGERKISVTPAGNPGVIEEESSGTIVGGRAYTTLIVGPAGELTATTIVEDRRPIANQGRLRFMNGAGQFAALDFFLVPAGTEISSVQPLRLSAAGSSSLFSILPGTLEMTIRIPDTQTIALGPVPLTVAGGGIYGIVAINGATAESADILLLDSFN